MMKKRVIFMQAIIVLLLSVLMIQSPLIVLAESATPDTPAPIEETENALPQATAAATAPNPQRHDPTTGVYDGAVYRLRNVAHGTYMDVDNEETDSGTNISTYQYNGKLNQQFRFRYLGQDLYELIPMNSPETYVRTAELGAKSNIEIYGASSSKTRFRVELQPNGAYVLYSQYNGFANAICFDTTRPNNVVETNYANLTQKAYAQWYLECVDNTVYDAYTKYYIRNVRTGLYLDVVERGTDCGTIVHARSLIGSENTQWRQIYDEETQAYMIVPVHYNRAKLTLNSTGNLTICSYRSDSTQRFRLEVTASTLGRMTCRITTSCSGYTEYLNMGDLMGDVPDYYYLKNGTDDSDLWIFEPVLFDSTDTTCLYMNTAQQTSVTGYGRKTVLIYQTPKLSRYKFEVTKPWNSSMSVSVYDNLTCTQPYFYRTLTSNSATEIVDLVCEPMHTYYFVLENATGATSAFSVRLRQFTVTYHSNNQENGPEPRNASQGIENILRYANSMNWYITNKPGMTASRAKRETNALTGYRDFDSEIFVYYGHGAAGEASYEWPWGSFLATELPPMSRCELAIWACCNSAAVSSDSGMSMVSQSVEKGATSAIGWTESIHVCDVNDYFSRFFSAICSGMALWEASQYAINYQHFFETISIVDSLVIAGNAGVCLFPQPQATSTSTAATQITETCIFDMSQYTLVSENESIGVKLYTRMLNGIPTDDFYLEFYNMDGEYTGMQKSSYTLDEATVAQFETEHAALLQQKTAVERQNLVYTYINGELHLIFRQIAENENGECMAVYIDALSGEVLQR